MYPRRSLATYAAALAAIMIAVPVGTAAAPADTDATDLRAPAVWLNPPVSQVLERHPFDGDVQRRVDDALEDGAYRSALIVAGEAVAVRQAADAWEEAQHEPNPSKAFFEAMVERVQAHADTLRNVSRDLADLTRDPITAAEVEALLVVSHLLVWAEKANHEAASYLTGVQGTTDLSLRVQRYTIVRPLALVDLYVATIEELLPTTPPPAGAVVDARLIKQVVAANGGTPGDWRVPEGGILHRLARHVTAGEEAMGSMQAATAHDVEHAVTHVPAAVDTARGAGLSGARLAMAGLDALWWVGEQERLGNGPEWGPLLRGLNASVEGAIYESKLLQDALGEDAGRPLWMLLLAGAGVAVLALVVVLVVRKRSRRAARRSITPGRRAALACVCAVLVVAPAVSAADGASANPHAEPVPILEDRGVGRLHMALDPDDVVHFVWSACVGAPRIGCIDIHHRSYDPRTHAWTPASTIVDGAINASFPQLHWTPGHFQLLWTEGGTYYDGAPVVLKWCALEQMACSGTPTILSDPDLQVFAPRVVVGPDGMLRVAWQSEYHYEDEARVVLREQHPGGWGPEVFFQTGSVLQRAPAVAVDGDGRAHVAWREMDPEEALGNIQQWFTYATVEPGASASSTPERLSDSPMYRRGVSLAVRDGMVHALYSLETDVYHREKSATDEDADWSPPANLSRMNRRIAGNDPILVTHGDADLTAVWVRGGTDYYRLMTAHQAGGVWSEPRELVGEPFNRLLQSPQVLHDSGGALHTVWKALRNHESYDQPARAYYRIFDETWDYAPPEVRSVTPGEGAWVRSDPVALAARVATDAGVDRDATRLLVNGAPVSYTVDPEGLLVAAAAGLEEGRHEVRLEFHDQAGGSTTNSSWFQVDRTPPALSFSVSDGNTTGITGWHRSPLTVEAHADALGGATARVQFDVDEIGVWPDFSDVSSLLEGRLFDLRLRAIDAAGNIDLGPALHVGWDATPPAVHLEAPAMSADGRVVVRMHEMTPDADPIPSDHHDHGDPGDDHHHAQAAAPAVAGPGSPVHMELVLRPLDGGEPTTRTAPLERGRITLEDIPAGRYRLSGHATDEAGNSAAAAVGNETITVDRDPPTLEVTTRGDGSRVLRATDDVSGVRLVRVEAGGSVLLEEKADGVGELEVVAPAVPVEASVRVEDVAGHVGTWRLHPDGILEDEDPVQAGDPSEDIHEGPPVDERIPAPLPWIAILVALPPARRLRRG